MFRQMYEEKYMRFPQGRTKAFTLSYDDGVEADKKLVAILDKCGLKGTFNLNSLLWDCENWHGKMDRQTTYETFKGGVHEVALHGARHIFLDKVPLPEAVNEIVQNRVYLEDMFGRIVRGMAYAYNSYNDEVVSVLGSLGVTYARTTEASHSFAIPRDWLRLKPTCHHGDPKFEELTDKFLSARADGEFKHREPLLFYVWGHSYEFDDNGNWQVIERAAERISESGDVWFATNGEIREYVRAYESLVFSMDGERVFNPSYRTVWVEIRGNVYAVAAGKQILFDKG